MRKGLEFTIHFIKNYLLNAVFITTLFFILLQIYMLTYPTETIHLQLVFILTIGVFIISTICSMYFGMKSSGDAKKKINIILQSLSSLRRGKYTERVDHQQIGILADELNELAEVMEEQVITIQRLGTEKVELHEKVHSAAVMEERQRLARELHDSISQQLFALSMMSSATIKLFDTNPQKAKNQMETIADIARKAQGEMRALLLHLRPIDLSGESLADGVLSLLKELKIKTNLIFDASVDEIEEIPKAVEEHIFRIIQEGLSNILRHSEATAIKLILTEKSHALYLFISDNGKGFDTNESKKISYGLKTMRERCEEIGGIFTLRSQTGKGTYIEIRVPLNRN